MEYGILNKIDSPEDLKKLDRESLNRLAVEIREFLISSVGLTGGHLASNLGVIELTLAIHKAFDSPKDHIIFDVGHQSYTHKLLTGRFEKFSTLRQAGGLSGFTGSLRSVLEVTVTLYPTPQQSITAVEATASVNNSSPLRQYIIVITSYRQIFSCVFGRSTRPDKGVQRQTVRPS